MVSQTKNPKELCPRCAQGKLVTDNESGEMFCSKCGFVISEKLQESGMPLHSMNTAIEQQPVHQRHLLCTTWDLQQLSIQSTRTLLVGH